MRSISRANYRALMRAKLGLAREEEGDDRLIGELLALMAKARADYTLELPQADGAKTRDWLALFGDGQCRRRSLAVALPGPHRKRRPVRAWTASIPNIVLRNWVAETAIRAVEDRGDVASAGPHLPHPADAL